MRQYFGAENVACTEGNFNSETGLPLSVFKIRGNEKIGIFEMGMNRVNEIGEISKVLKSKYGIITNIGNAHIGLLGSRKNIALEKRKSFDYIPADGAAFVPFEDDFAELCTENVKGKIVKYGLETAQEYGVKFIKDEGLAGTVFSVDGELVRLSLGGKYNFQNALGVIALAKELGVSAKAIKAGLENMVAVTGRMEIKELKTKTGKNIQLIADCYNANPDSMGKVIDFCGGLGEAGKKIYVLGDMKELGTESATEHRKVAEKLLAAGSDYVFLVGPEMKNAADLLSEKQFANYSYFEANDEESFKRISEKLLSVIADKDTVLLKGSHSMALEKLIPMLVLEGEV
jgi:UDP-N-acetylmuramoyl-tripeptide--D-alanyl-D-alanine ligase